jgi:hypothetical protein
MKAAFSEFSYGYALIDELVNWHGIPLQAAPILPTLYAEGRIGGGYDVMLDSPGVPLFIQFKVPKYLDHGNSSEFRAGLMTLPYYRMSITPRAVSNQHQLLLDLEALNNEVRYASPIFHTQAELNEKFFLGRIWEDSLWMAPSTIGPLPDDDEHVVVYQSNTVHHFCSEPRVLDAKSDGQEMLISLEKRLALASSDMGDIVLEKLYLQMRSLVGDRLREPRDITRYLSGRSLRMSRYRRYRILSALSFIAMQYFGCQLFWITYKDSDRR